MNEEITNKIRELYDNIMCFPNKVLNIFNDFFGEERVDMQGFWSFEEFLQIVLESKLSFFFSSKVAVWDNPEFKSKSAEDKAIIENLLDHDALDCTVTSSMELFTYFLPMMSTAILQMSLQGSILVHFPHVRVTNEHDKFVDINHLWVKVGIKMTGAGTGRFLMNRSEYELSHMKANYLHSHVNGIPLSNFSLFLPPCLGRGPISTTVSTLAIEYDEAMWKLFCLELDRYVRVESLSGVPYRYLEHITNRVTCDGETNFTMHTSPLPWYRFGSTFCKDDMKDFIMHLIKSKKLKFNFKGSYGFAMSYLNYRILISNEFIEWFNLKCNLGKSTPTYNEVLNKKILRECIISNGKIRYLVDNNRRLNYSGYEGAYVCTFKGEPVNLHIVENNTDDTNKILLINAEIADTIARAILTIVNYKYGREERKEEAGISTPAIYL